MQRLTSAMISGASSQECARLTLRAIPELMRVIREEVRRQPRCGLTLAQFRALVFVNFHPDETLSALAGFIGLSTPAASRMVELLVRRGLLARRSHHDDRRRIRLALTARGQNVFLASSQATQAVLAQRFDSLPDREIRRVIRAMNVIIETFKVGGAAPVRAKSRSTP